MQIGKVITALGQIIDEMETAGVAMHAPKYPAEDSRRVSELNCALSDAHNQIRDRDLEIQNLKKEIWSLQRNRQQLADATNDPTVPLPS